MSRSAACGASAGFSGSKAVQHRVQVGVCGLAARTGGCVVCDIKTLAMLLGSRPQLVLAH